jgi:hypothetical protein
VLVLCFADHLPVFTQPDVEKWPEPENGPANNCKEVLCIRKCAGQKVLMCLLFYLPAKAICFLDLHFGLMQLCGLFVWVLCSTKLSFSGWNIQTNPK